MNQFNNYPMQQPQTFAAPSQPQTFSAPPQPSEAQMKVEQAFASPPMTNYAVPDPNSNASYQHQQFQPASTQFSLPSMPQIQTFEAYPQVQTQITLQGMPPLTVNTPRIDPTKYS